MNSGNLSPDAEHWDYIVVGVGSAGSVVAARLSENPSCRVLALEAGPPDTFMLKAFGLGYYWDLSRYEWGYWSQPDPTRNMRSDHWRRGRVVGGTGSINGMNYVRGTRADYDRWAAKGNIGWSADDVMPLFRSLERCLTPYTTPPDPGIRGMSGPLPIREVRNCHPLTEAFLKSAQVAGFGWASDYNGMQQEGVAYGQFNQRRGFRRTSADVLLKPALRRKNIKLVTDALVHRLTLVDRRVTGVIVECDGVVQEVHAEKIILCAGAINTPQILMLSGIGNAETLRSLGIKVMLDRPLVGQNLMEHPLLRTAFRVNRPSYNPTEGLLQKAAFLGKFLLKGQGPIATPAEAQAFLRTSPEEPQPDIQMHFAPLAAVFSKDRTFYKSVKILPYPAMSIHINKSHPKSRGQIRLAGTDPKAKPLIEPNLLGDERDVETLVRSVNLVRRIISAEPLASMITEQVDPRPDLVSHADLVAYVKDSTSLAYHPCGTCRMGVDEAAVVTPDLKVRDLENLWIADASVMPDLISGNINAACMMIGEKLGRELSRSAGMTRPTVLGAA